MNQLSSLKTFTLEFHPEISSTKREEMISTTRVFFNLDYDDISPDIVFSIGGDGTLMRSARKYAEKGSLFVGVNMGKVSFLNGFGFDNWENDVKVALEGNNKISNRMMLHGEIKDQKFSALNDVVVHRGELPMSNLKVYVNNALVANVRGDGVIVSTPTGSTAYNQSAGGPVVAPDSRVLIITPIAPFGASIKPIVIADDSIITITSQDNGEKPYVISYDSETMKENIRQHSLTIKKSFVDAKILYPADYSHFGRVRELFN